MEQLVNGRFEYEVPQLILSADKIEVTTKVGENYRGELHMGTAEDMKLKGIATVSDARIVLGKHKYSGTSVRLPFGVDVTGLQAGECCRGQITLSTSIGEYEIPVFVQVEASALCTSLGNLASLDDFVRLAASDYREAFHIFTGNSFKELLRSEDTSYQTLYKGMSQNPVTYQHLEEFLIGAGKKEAMQLYLEETEAACFRMTVSEKQSVEIRKNTWGYVHIDIEVIGDFIEVPKRVITADDFVGSICSLDYIIREDRIGAGRNYGKILLKTVYGTRTFSVMASHGPEVRVDMGAIRGQNRMKLMQAYMDYRMNRIDAAAWNQKTKTLLECVREMADYPLEYTLYEAYVDYLSGEQNEARDILRSLQEHSFANETLEAKAYFLYLCHLTDLIATDQLDVVGKIRDWYQKKQESLGLLWVLMQVDEDVIRTPSKKLYLMDNIFEMGCRSPLLYLEAYTVVRNDEGLLKRTNKFWKQVMLFVCRKELLTEELALRVAYLSINEKKFTETMYRILSAAYEKYPVNGILEAICKLLMKGNPRKAEYFKWYELAVEKEVRITRLYEYYIETMPENYQKMLPQVIRMYFAYNNTLSDRKKAFVYANVLCNKEIDPHTFASYREAMEAFANEKLLQGKINENYAALYQNFVPQLKNREMGKAMASVVFVNRLYCEDKKVRSVIVCHGPLAQEAVYPCVNGVAYIQLYTEDAKILFQDEKCRRYMATVDYNVQKLMDQEPFITQCMGLDVEHPGLLLHTCEQSRQGKGITVRNISAYQHVVEAPEFTGEYKQILRQLLLQYYAENAGDDTLDSYLRKINYHEFAKVDKVLLVEVLIARGMYETAFRLVCEYGYEQIAIHKLVRLCSRMISRVESVNDEELLLLAYTVFEKGKYDETILKYLIAYYEGPVLAMCDIWESASAFQLETYALDEKILMYSMFVRKYVDIGARVLKHYVQEGGREIVILSYMTFSSYGYFMEEQPFESYIFQLLQLSYERELEMDTVCRLALLKYYTEQTTMTDMEETQVENLLEEFQHSNLRFAFYQKLPVRFLQPYQLEDRVFIEQKAFPKDRVTLHYTLTSDALQKQEYKSEPMKRMYRGIFSREFILFYGETLQYYITIEHDGVTTETPVQSLAMPTANMEGRSKYQLLNQMLAAQKLDKEEVLKEKLHQYRQAQQVANMLFTLE
ncbi:MAG: DUF5717 family protein [Lachnospiraceae bacterium]|nr:DUF5717 family protein [Lachnospiraceae bacterium]